MSFSQTCDVLKNFFTIIITPKVTIWKCPVTKLSPKNIVKIKGKHRKRLHYKHFSMKRLQSQVFFWDYFFSQYLFRWITTDGFLCHITAAFFIKITLNYVPVNYGKKESLMLDMIIGEWQFCYQYIYIYIYIYKIFILYIIYMYIYMVYVYYIYYMYIIYIYIYLYI